MAALQKKFNAWCPQILERYPLFKVEYKNVPDDQNGEHASVSYKSALFHAVDCSNLIDLTNDGRIILGIPFENLNPDGTTL